MAIFRDRALDRFSSPEQLDYLMRLTRPRSWIALACYGLLIAGALVWGIFGRVLSETDGEGLLIRRGGVTEVVTNASGPIEKMLVDVGTRVKRGDVVAVVRQIDLDRQLADLRERRSSVEREHRDLQLYRDSQLRLSDRSRAVERDNLELSVRNLVLETQSLAERRTKEEELLRLGIVTRQTLLTTDQELNLARDRLASARLQIENQGLARLEESERLDREVDARARELRELGNSIAELEANRAETVNVITPVDGRVLELKADRGQVVQPGTGVLNVEVDSDEMIALVFVPADTDRPVKVGMKARISPKNVRPEEHGFILGEVTWAAEFPSTSRGLQRLLGNSDLVSKLMAKGPPLQVEVRLDRDPATPTGLRWSSSRGPEFPVGTGALVTGSVIVREDRPLDMVIPRLRKSLGLGA